MFEISSPETQITRSDAIPAFEALRAQAKANGVTGMTLEEINAEIEKARSGVEE